MDEVEPSELDLLREFYARWRRLHARLNGMRGRKLTDVDTTIAATMAQQVIDQARLVDRAIITPEVDDALRNAVNRVVREEWPRGLQ